jgi:hypothetical protein
LPNRLIAQSPDCPIALLTNPRFLAIITSVAIIASTSCSSVGALVPGANTTPSLRVLFIGNSYTSFNGGLDQQFKGLDPTSETHRIDAGGYTLQNHWEAGNAPDAIKNGKWDYVVLQEQSQTPVVSKAIFRQYASYFDIAIKADGAETVLLMTWQRPDSAAAGVTTANLEDAYNAAAKSLGAIVAPAGVAFARSLVVRPDISLYGPDGHPTVAGTYLAGCVVYVTLLHKNPVGNPFSYGSITPEVRAHLQLMAAQAAGY